MAASRVKPEGTGAKSLGALAPRVTRAAYRTHGFPVATLIGDWQAIAGPDLAAFTRPERLAWPQGGGARQTSRGATLYLAADGPRALEVQHAAPQLIDRLNTHFGYRAVTQIRIVQAPVGRARRRSEPPAGRVEAAREPPELEAIGDDRLRHALARLARRVR